MKNQKTTCPDCAERPSEKRGVCGRCYQRRRRRRLGKRELVLRFPTSITVSMTDELEAFLRHQASIAGLQVSVFVRHLLVGYAERLKVTPDSKSLPGAVGPVLGGALGKAGELLTAGPRAWARERVAVMPFAATRDGPRHSPPCVGGLRFSRLSC